MSNKDLNQQKLHRSLLKDVEDICSFLIAQHKIAHSRKDNRLSSSLLRWLDYVNRYIPLANRDVYYSNKFPVAIPKNIMRDLKEVIRKIKCGEDLNPYQSLGLTLHNDISGSNRKKRTDLMWADWKIHHLHVSNDINKINGYFVKRSDWLLFAYFGTDYALLIDVKKHNEMDVFSDPKLVHTMIESWPDFMERYRLNGISSSDKGYTPQEIKELRISGVNPILCYNNKSFRGPGWGFSTASTPIELTMIEDKISLYLEEISKSICDECLEFQLNAKKNGVENPEFKLILDSGMLCIIEMKQNIGYRFPKYDGVIHENIYSELNKLLLPIESVA